MTVLGEARSPGFLSSRQPDPSLRGHFRTLAHTVVALLGRQKDAHVEQIPEFTVGAPEMFSA